MKVKVSSNKETEEICCFSSLLGRDPLFEEDEKVTVPSTMNKLKNELESMVN